MAFTLDSTGLVKETAAEIRTRLENVFRQIYGEGINLNSNTPDGQLIGILIQDRLDLQELVSQVYSSYSVDGASGSTLDQRVSLNGIQRKSGSRTVVAVTVTASAVTTLVGADDASVTPFTVADSLGNNFYLLKNSSLVVGENTLDFEAENFGPLAVAPASISTIVTPVVGVESVTNNLKESSIGSNEETDLELRRRQALSVGLPSVGSVEGIRAAILNLNGVSFCQVYENNTGVVDARGLPPKSIWAVVEGGVSSEIASAIYNKRNAGVGMNGLEVVEVSRDNGETVVIRFSRPETEEVFVRLNLNRIDLNKSVNIDGVREQLVTNFNVGVGEIISVNDLARAIKEIDSNLEVEGGISVDGTTYSSFLRPSAVNKRFALNLNKVMLTDVG